MVWGCAIDWLAVGPEGTLWWENRFGEFGRLMGSTNPCQTKTTVLSVPQETFGEVDTFAVAPDGSFWFTDVFDDKIGHLRPGT
jgi:streptogramin lyase